MIRKMTFAKWLIFTSIAVPASPAFGDTPSRPLLRELWAITGSSSKPESAYLDPATQRIFVSNMAGGPIDMTAQGYIQELSLGGKVVAARWVTGLNSPKGLRSRQGVLWVTAVNEVVGMKIGSDAHHKDGEIVERIPVPGARCLNDLEISPDGTIFVSDIFSNRVFAIKGGKVSVYAEGEDLESPNGLLWYQGRLIGVGSNLHLRGKVDFDNAPKQGHLYAIDSSSKRKQLLHPFPLGMLDAVEVDDAGNYLVSDWLGSTIYRIHPDGKKEVLLKTTGNTADFSFVHGRSLILVPFTGENAVKAFQVR